MKIKFFIFFLKKTGKRTFSQTDLYLTDNGCSMVLNEENKITKRIKVESEIENKHTKIIPEINEDIYEKMKKETNEEFIEYRCERNSVILIFLLILI